MYVDDLLAPPLVKRTLVTRQVLTHTRVEFVGLNVMWACCTRELRELGEDIYRPTGEIVTCLECIKCRGCPACKENFITAKSLSMGKWETMDGRKLYPFEMDNEHLMNAIAKLYRDRHHFKDKWEDWVVVLEDEAQKRGLT